MQRLTQMIIPYYEKFPGFGAFATIEKESGAFIGWTALKDLDKTELIEIGYRYFFDFWGKGYATEGAKKCLEYGFIGLNLHQIIATCTKGNSKSENVMKKIGMKNRL